MKPVRIWEELQVFYLFWLTIIFWTGLGHGRVDGYIMSCVVYRVLCASKNKVRKKPVSPGWESREGLRCGSVPLPTGDETSWGWLRCDAWLCVPPSLCRAWQSRHLFVYKRFLFKTIFVLFIAFVFMEEPLMLFPASAYPLGFPFWHGNSDAVQADYMFFSLTEKSAAF